MLLIIKKKEIGILTNDLTTQIEGDFIALLDDHFSLPETFDSDLDAQIAKWYSNPPKVFPKRDYPWRGRWRKLGTLGGDLIQREILSIERNYEKQTGNKPRFWFEKNADGTPMFEDFAKVNKLVEHNGEKFYLYGTCDGIMNYVTDDGEIIRVGL